jgi:hypothetical protein
MILRVEQEAVLVMHGSMLIDGVVIGTLDDVDVGEEDTPQPVAE